MAPLNLNLSGFLNVFKLIAKPSLCLPHATVPTFADLPVPLEKAFEKDGRKVTIRAVVLDKDDCFAYPDTNQIHPPYLVSAQPVLYSRANLANLILPPHIGTLQSTPERVPRSKTRHCVQHCRRPDV